MTKQSIVDFVREGLSPPIPDNLADRMLISPTDNGQLLFQCRVSPAEAERLVSILTAALHLYVRGETVILDSVRPNLLSGLPSVDQQAILAALGKPVTVSGCEFLYQQIEIEFTDAAGDGHTIWVEPGMIRPV